MLVHDYLKSGFDGQPKNKLRIDKMMAFKPVNSWWILKEVLVKSFINIFYHFALEYLNQDLQIGVSLLGEDEEIFPVGEILCPWVPAQIYFLAGCRECVFSLV